MKTTVSIPGIHCASCAALIKDVSTDFPAIRSADVDLKAKTVSLDHDEHFDLSAWTRAVEDLNKEYKVSVVSQ